MSPLNKNLVLVVDDEISILQTTSMLLTSAGYNVSTAQNGFEGLLQLGSAKVDLIISDLNMPQMSGFEFLSVVRRRFPDIPVIAVSGAYEFGDQVPGGVIADAFHSKARHRPEELLRSVSDLISSKLARAKDHQRESAPVWIPRNGKDFNGVPFIVLTCTQCLRSFPLSVLHEDVQEIQETICLFCANGVRYVIDFSIEVASPQKRSATQACS